MGDLRFVAAAVGLGTQLVEQRADGLHDFDVGLFIPAAHVVGLTQPPSFQNAANGTAVVFDVEPIAYLHAVAIDRQGLAGQGVDDHERDQLLGKMVGPVVVAAIGGEHRKAVGVVPGAHQVVGRGFACAVGAVGFIGVSFCKGRGIFSQSAIDLVGADVQEAEGGLVILWQTTPVGPHGFQEAEGAHHISLDEVLRAVDGAVDVAFRREVEHRARAVLGQQPVDEGAITQVALHEGVSRIALQADEVFHVAGVGEFVEVDNGLVADSQPVEYEITANEAGTAGDENILHLAQFQLPIIIIT